MFVGYTRFSLFVPESKAWNISNLSDQVQIEQYKNQLFNDNRMSTRIKIFGEYSLPILQQMSDNHNYLHIIQYSDILPQKYKNILYEWEKKYKFIELLEIATNSEQKTTFYNVVKEFLLKNASKKENIVFGLFGLDDDDLLSTDYLDSSRKYINENNVGMVLTYGKGLTAFLNQGNFSNIKEVYLPKINIGQMYISSYSLTENKFIFPKNGNHLFIDKYSPTIIDSTEIKFVWIRHLEQDTAQNKTSLSNQLKFILEDMDNFPNYYNLDLMSDKFLINFEESENITSAKLLNNKKVQLTNNFYNFDINLLGGKTWQIEYKLECGVNIQPKSVLVSFVLEGQTLDGNHDIQGLTLSDNKDIGYYRYIMVVPYENSGSISFYLPTGVCCKGMRFRAWYAKDVINLLDVSVMESKTSLLIQ